jgi:capsular exopolysaccharide synthesis family protein
MADIIPTSGMTSLEPYVAPSTQQFAPNGPVSAVSLWKAFRARWIWAILAGVVLGGGAGATAFFANPARFHSSALIRVLSTKGGIFEHAQGMETDKSPFQRAQPSLVMSHDVLQAAATSEKGLAIAATKKYGDLSGWLERNIKVSYLEDTDLMQISLAGPDAHDTAELVNAVVNAYTKESADAEKRSSSDQSDKLRSIYLARQEEIRRDSDNLAALAKTLRTVDSKALSTPQTVHIQELVRAAHNEVAAIRTQLRELDVQMQTKKAIAESPGAVGAVLVELQVESDPTVVKQIAVVRDKQDILTRTQNTSQPGTPSLNRSIEAVKLAREELDRLRVEARVRAEALVKARVQAEANAEIKRIDGEVHIRQAQLRTALETEDRLQKELDRLGTGSFELESKRAEIEKKTNMLNKVGEQLDQLEIETQLNRSRIQVMQMAKDAEFRNTRSRDTLAGLVGFAGFFGGVFGTSLLELRARRIQSADDVTGELGMNVVGTLPVLPSRFSAGTSAGDGYWGHVVTESVAYIRTVVLSARESQQLRILMITSAQSQEGKTMLASNLALSIARTGRRTLLIDGDLRRPSVAPLFGVSEGPGIAEILRGEAVASDCVVPSAMPGLSILPAGRCCRQVVQELARDGIESLFRELRDQFDFIVVDSSPILPVSDSLLLGRLVDAVVFCVRPKVSRAPSVHAAHAMLSRLNIRVLGTVINGARRHSGGGGDYLYLLGDHSRDSSRAAANP